jgi:hypothetical protein
LCRECGREAVGETGYCALHQRAPRLDGKGERAEALIDLGMLAALLVVAAVLVVCWPRGKQGEPEAAGVTEAAVMVGATVGPTGGETKVPTAAVVTAVPTAVPTVVATAVPTVAPTVVVNRAAAVALSPERAAAAAAVVEAEASGMGRRGRQLVACNLLADVYDVHGSWEALVGRWPPLGLVLEGNAPRTPGSEAFIAVNAAADGDVCAGYPRCRHLGSVMDLYTWYEAGYVEVGEYEIWLGESGQMLVCVEGLPELPVVTTK